VNVLFYGDVLNYTNGEKSRDINDCSDIQSLAEKLGGYYGERFFSYLFGNETCFFLVNGKGIMLTGGLKTKLKPEDKIEILPFVHAG